MTADKNVIEGRAWVVGDNVDTDLIIAGPYLTIRDIDEQAQHTLEVPLPDFASEVEEGDVIVAGTNFGAGSSREQAPKLLKHLGVGAVVAAGFARIYFRNSINLGLPALESKAASQGIAQGDEVRIELQEGRVHDVTTGETFQAKPYPDFLMGIIQAGGAIPYYKAQVEAEG